MNADHSAQLRLLDLQAADTSLAQLAHRRKTLPELAAVAERDQRLTALGNDIVEVQTRIGDIAADQARLEGDVDSVWARAARDEKRLLDGGLPSKELEGLQHEITTLARRQAALEDELLEVMEQREQGEGELASLNSLRSDIEVERDAYVAARDSAFLEIDTAVGQRSAERSAIAAEIPGDLSALYERAREHSGGVGAAMLRQRRCEGCHIELSGSELNSVRTAAEDEVVRCDNCRRILVRTAESGL
ncbi:MAG: C4-type zinc ribbon domain-containing protein [Actinomycetota bacterium]|nr:C4-type zinc ribbon domain-containing protein [Actinomycetota bacterium]